MKLKLIQFYQGLYIGSIPLGLGLILIALSVLIEVESLTIAGITLMVIGIVQFRCLKKYRDG